MEIPGIPDKGGHPVAISVGRGTIANKYHGKLRYNVLAEGMKQPD